MKKCLVAGRKGGIGKTTLARHLAFYGVEQGLRVLAVDLDNVQANFSDTWRIIEEENGLTRPRAALTAKGLFERGNRDQPAACGPGMFYVPTDEGVLKLERAALQEVIDVGQARFEALGADYDVCIIDTGGAVSNLLVAALAVSNFAVSPCKPDRDAISGMEKFFANVRQVRDDARINPTLAPLWVLPNQVSKSRAYHRDVLAQMRAHWGDHVLPLDLYERAAIDIAKDRAVWRTDRGESTSAAAQEMKSACALIYTGMGF